MYYVLEDLARGGLLCDVSVLPDNTLLPSSCGQTAMLFWDEGIAQKMADALGPKDDNRFVVITAYLDWGRA